MEELTDKQIFDQMIKALEDVGKCRYTYHALARKLFGEPLGWDDASYEDEWEDQAEWDAD